MSCCLKLHLFDGSNNLHFFYDVQDKPAVVISTVLPTLICTTCRATPLVWLTATAPKWYLILTMLGVRCSVRLVRSPARWVRSSPLGIAGMCMTKRRGSFMPGWLGWQKYSIGGDGVDIHYVGYRFLPVHFDCKIK